MLVTEISRKILDLLHPWRRRTSPENGLQEAPEMAQDGSASLSKAQIARVKAESELEAAKHKLIEIAQHVSDIKARMNRITDGLS